MSLCILPWIQRHINEQGYQQLCCVADDEWATLHDAAGVSLHVSRNLSGADLLNSPDLKAIRKTMRQGEWPAACQRCKQCEDAGSTSSRQHYNARFNAAETMEPLLSRTQEDGTLEDPSLRFLDIRLGNVCNLTCRMCGPQASRLWAPHFNQVQPARHQKPELAIRVLGQNNWVKRETVTHLIEPCLPTLESIHFAGGEPLIVPELIQALTYCVESGRAGEIDLSFNTNLTVLPEGVTKLWPHFRSVLLVISIDGFGKVNDYIRRPSRWADIDRNLRLVDEHFEDWKISYALVSAVFQIYNALNIQQLLEYMRDAGFRRIVKLPQLIPLFEPAYLSAQALPNGAKRAVREQLEAEIRRAEGWNDPALSSAIGSIRSTLAYMDEASTTHQLADFKSFTEATDRVFGQSWKESLPELAPHLEPRLSFLNRALGR